MLYIYTGFKHVLNIYGLFNDVINISDDFASKERMISE
jgi:hypothetical protein